MKVISTWNFDLKDCDKVLRIECASNIADDIIGTLQVKGFQCEELK